MAQNSQSHHLNVPGPVFVDLSCINCGTCYHLSPSVFIEQEDQSTVSHQPDSLETWGETKRAVISCPTNSIGVRKAPEDFKNSELQLPLLITDDVYYCGYTSKDSYGASSYFITSSDGNILIDSPRFNPQLVKEIEKLGGVKFMVLTHRDDVADHAKFAEHFKLQRIIHHDEVTPDTSLSEIILEEGFDENFSADVKLIPVPGHTKGHIVILYKDKFLFTGDHLFVEDDKLTASRGVCWYSWAEQIKSMKRLQDYSFEWVLPGHGGWGQFPEGKARDALAELISMMEKRPS